MLDDGVSFEIESIYRTVCRGGCSKESPRERERGDRKVTLEFDEMRREMEGARRTVKRRRGRERERE